MTDEHYKQWLNEIKVGDDVIIERNTLPPSFEMSTINGTPFPNRHQVANYSGAIFVDGILAIAVSGHTRRWRLLEPIDELLDKMNLINMRRQLKAIDWNKVDDEIVRDVWNLTNR